MKHFAPYLAGVAIALLAPAIANAQNPFVARMKDMAEGARAQRAAETAGGIWALVIAAAIIVLVVVIIRGLRRRKQL